MALQHRNPIASRASTAAYNFVPLPERVVTVPRPVSHDVYHEGRHTGYFEVDFTTLTPLYIRSGLSTREPLRPDDPRSAWEIAMAEKANRRTIPDDFRKAMKNTPDFFYTHRREDPVIPGSSLRGMLRSLLEIVTYSKVERISKTHRIFYRAVAAGNHDALGRAYKDVMGSFGRNVFSGYITKKDNRWHIHPALLPKSVDDRLKDENILKVRATHKTTGKHLLSLPSVLSFNDSRYQPQVVPVVFTMSQLKPVVASIQEFVPGIAQQGIRGVLVCTGNMLETNDGQGNARSPRRKHPIVLERDKGANPIPINTHAVEDYEATLTPFITDHLGESGVLKEGQPVFYVKENGNNEIFCFGHTPNFRLPATGKRDLRRAVVPNDFVPQYLRNRAEFDFADALFGYTDKITKSIQDGKTRKVKQGDIDRSYAGRVSVTDARMVAAPNGKWLSQGIIVPRILASPKPTAYQHYLEQSNDVLERLTPYTAENAQLRGYKLYWSQQAVTADSLRESDPIHMVNNVVKPGSTQHTQMKPVKEGVTFRFRIYFENLSNEELGALTWVLRPQGTASKYVHRLGMGKALGMGAVHINKVGLYLTDREKRYACLFDSEGWQTGGYQATDRLSGLIQKFEEYMWEKLKPLAAYSRLANLKRIAILLKMLEWRETPVNSQRYQNQTLEEFKARRVLPYPMTDSELQSLIDISDPEEDEIPEDFGDWDEQEEENDTNQEEEFDLDAIVPEPPLVVAKKLPVVTKATVTSIRKTRVFVRLEGIDGFSDEIVCQFAPTYPEPKIGDLYNVEVSYQNQKPAMVKFKSRL